MEGSKLLVESDTIAHFQFGFDVFGVQVVVHFFLATLIHFLGSHLDAAMIRSVVAQQQVLQHRQDSQRALDGEYR